MSCTITKDGIIRFNSKDKYKTIVEENLRKVFPVKKLSEAKRIFGINITRNKRGHIILMNHVGLNSKYDLLESVNYFTF